MGSLTKSWKTTSLRVFGPSPSSTWGAMVWGVGSWGMKVAGPTGVPTIIWNFGKLIGSGSLIASSAVYKNANKSLACPYVFTYANSDRALRTGNGYYYNVPDRTTDLEDQSDATFTCATAGSTSWTAASAGGTSWT